MRQLRAAVVLAVLAVASCSRAGEDSQGDAVGADTLPTTPPYVAAPLAEWGRIEGTIAWTGPAPSSTTVALSDSTARICRTRSLHITPARINRGGIAESLVWLEGIRAGKPLPASRRFELAKERCRLSPPVQPAIVGGTLNVVSLDPLEHSLQFVQPGTAGTIARVDQFDAGQVVPLESVLVAPGPVEVVSDRFRWMVAAIHVFDHPYFALTETGGTFAIDSVPTGRHTLVVWHPLTGRRDTTVTVSAGDTIQMRLEIGVGEA